MDPTLQSWIMAGIAFGSGFMLARSIYRQAKPTVRPAPPRIDDETVDAAIRANETIEAIRQFRARTGCGLKEARDAVEQRARELGVRR
ncbi:MAG TPA: hypothetical protein VFR91_06545 [Dyella sp.]|nr:hypothetical protein [Dyella sp.]